VHVFGLSVELGQAASGVLAHIPNDLLHVFQMPAAKTRVPVFVTTTRWEKDETRCVVKADVL
jgi:hypothetical protein